MILTSDEFTSTVHADMVDNYCWINGPISIELVDMQNMARVPLTGMFQGMGSDVIILSVLQRSGQSVLALVSTRQGQSMVLFSLQTNNSLIKTIAEVTEISTSASGLSMINQTFSCMEASLDSSLVFIGGGTEAKATQTSDAVLYAVTFDRQMQKIDKLLLTDATESKRAISCLRRDPTKNILYAGVFQDVYLIEWTGSHFCVLRSLDNLHSCRHSG